MELKATPRDSVDALRLMRKHQDVLLEPGDDVGTKEHIQNVIGTYIVHKRAGNTDLEFLDWYENADLGELDGEGDGAPDPTE